jgi:uncharacterized membrane protein
MALEFLEWASLAVRWLHLTAGIAWIGSSFYFVWLDNHLRPQKQPVPGVAGELWAVHGGGFYHNQKYLVAPAALPERLHWFKWEAYTTWLSGFLLLVLVYYAQPGLYLLDQGKYDLDAAQGIILGLVVIFGGWVVYDELCRSSLGRNNFAFGLVWYGLLVGATYLLTQLYSDRAAFLHVGAIIGTAMVANVFRVIIPNQKIVVADLLAGRTPDPRLGLEAKQRSLHNNYMTLPVLLIMISTHYPALVGSPVNWLLLALLGAAGWGIRHFFNLRHKDKTQPAYLAVPALVFVAVAVLAGQMRRAPAATAATDAVPFIQVSGIVATHCVSCHTARPTHEGITEPPKGVVFDTADDLQRHAAQIQQQAVAAELMPLGNETGMTPADRARLGRWIADGAKVGSR